MSKNIVIGLALKNEERSIITTMESLRVSLGNFISQYTGVSCKIVICLNNCTDRSEAIIREYILQNCYNDIEIIFESLQGKLFAQINIIKWSDKLFPDYTLIFIDADVIIDPFCISEMYRVYNTEAEGFVLCYATSKPLLDFKHWLHRLQYVHFRYKRRLYKQRWLFKGQCFIFGNEVKDIYRSILDRYIDDFQKNKNVHFPVTDDVLLSRILQDKYQKMAVKMVSSAVVYYQPVSSVGDWVREQIRTKTEFANISRHFPELKYLLTKKSFDLELKWKNTRSGVFSFRDFVKIKLYAWLDYWVKFFALYVGLPIYKYSGLCMWPKTITTKNISTYKFPVLNNPVVLGSWNVNTDWSFCLTKILPSEILIDCTVVMSICFFQGKIVLVRNRRGWEQPGGHVESGEDLDMAIRREILEETGVSPSSVVMFGYKSIYNKVLKFSESTKAPRPTYNYIKYYIVELKKEPSSSFQRGDDSLEVGMCTILDERIKSSAEREIFIIANAIYGTIKQTS